MCFNTYRERYPCTSGRQKPSCPQCSSVYLVRKGPHVWRQHRECPVLTADPLHRYDPPRVEQVHDSSITSSDLSKNDHGPAPEKTGFLARAVTIPRLKEHAVLCQEVKALQEEEGNNLRVCRFLLKSLQPY